MINAQQRNECGCEPFGRACREATRFDYLIRANKRTDVVRERRCAQRNELHTALAVRGSTHCTLGWCPAASHRFNGKALRDCCSFPPQLLAVFVGVHVLSGEVVVACAASASKQRNRRVRGACCRSIMFCALTNNGGSFKSEATLVMSLLRNPTRFTGYLFMHARRIHKGGQAVPFDHATVGEHRQSPRVGACHPSSTQMDGYACMCTCRGHTHCIKTELPSSSSSTNELR